MTFVREQQRCLYLNRRLPACFKHKHELNRDRHSEGFGNTADDICAADAANRPMSTGVGGRAGITARTALVEPSGGCGLCGGGRGGGVAGGMDVLLAWGCVSQRQPGGMKIALIADTEKDLRLLASEVAYVISHVT